jgi:hypothetical protein
VDPARSLDDQRQRRREHGDREQDPRKTCHASVTVDFESF